MIKPLTLAALGAAFLLSPAAAQTACDKRAQVTDHLKRKYSEVPTALGVANNGGLVELLTSEDGRTWTLIITLPNGMTCLMAAGEVLLEPCRSTTPESVDDKGVGWRQTLGHRPISGKRRCVPCMTKPSAF